MKGLVASLIDLPQTSSPYVTALEVSAGGKLYNVVVEDETVGTQLLKKGNLKKRITIIPLTKVNPNVISKEVSLFFSNLVLPSAHLSL